MSKLYINIHIMEIYKLLPPELQSKVKYFALEHPTAQIIKEDIKRLRCNEHYTFRDEAGKIFCKVDGRDFYTNEYFRVYKRSRSLVIYGTSVETESETSDEYLDDVFNRLFFVSSSSSDDE